MPKRPPRSQPSYDVIRAACDAIRVDWSEREYRLRAGLPPDQGITFIVVRAAELGLPPARNG